MPTLRVRSADPLLTGAEFASPYQYVVITFDVPVWTEQGCEDLLDSESLLAMGEPGNNGIDLPTLTMVAVVGSKFLQCVLIQIHFLGVLTHFSCLTFSCLKFMIL